MTVQVRAKFRCNEKNQSESGFNLVFWSVRSGSAENDAFYRYTPAGKLELSTINDNAAAGFDVGKAYYLDFTPAD